MICSGQISFIYFRQVDYSLKRSSTDVWEDIINTDRPRYRNKSLNGPLDLNQDGD